MQELGAAFIQEQRAVYGWGPEGAPSYYAADTFNEMRPKSSEPAYLAAISRAVYQAGAVGAAPAMSGPEWGSYLSIQVLAGTCLP